MRFPKFINSNRLFCLIFFVFATSFVFAQKPVPYLQTPTPNSIWVNWRTTISLESKVLYGESASSLDEIATGDTQTLTDPGDNYTKNYYYHGVQLTNLKPGTRYFYKVVSESETSDVYSFKTSPADGSTSIYRFIILGDHQLYDDRYERLMKAAKAKAEEKYGTPIEDHINLITNVGDQVDKGTLKQYEEVHFKRSESLSPNLPILTIVGNHETYGTLGLNAYAAHYFYDNIEYKGIKSGSEFYYATQQGRALFLMLSSEGIHTNNTQLSWAKQVIETAKNDPNIDWIFSYNHRPLQAEQYIGDISTWVVNQIMPLLNTTEKSVMNVSGHHHLYHRGQLRDYPTYHIITGGAAWDQRWGQSTEKDFDDVQKTIDYWPFQIVELNPAEKSMYVETYVIGNQVETFSQAILVDSFSRKFGQKRPNKPSVLPLTNETIELPYTFQSSPYSTESGYEYNSVQFQVSSSSDFQKLEFDLIRDYENIYGAHPSGCVLTDINKGVDIFKQEIAKNKLYNGNHYIRVRHRDKNAEWSEWSDPVSFTTINGLSGECSLISAKRIYASGENLNFSFSNARNESNQWVGIYKETQTPGSSSPSIIWKYMGGESGTVIFDKSTSKFDQVTSGVYYAALFKDGGYEVIAKSGLFYVGIVPYLESDKLKYNVGEAITVGIHNAPKLTNDWIGIYKMGQTPGPSPQPAASAWGYVKNATDNALKIQSASLSKGYYFITYMMQDKYFEPGDRIFIQVGEEISTLSLDKTTYYKDEPIVFHYADGPGTPKDYIGIYKEGDVYGVDELTTYLYVYGEVTGDLSWDKKISGELLPEGNYYAYFFTNDSYDAVSNKVTFTVSHNVNSGLKQFSSGEGVKIFPNPAKSQISVELENKLQADITAFLYDISGNLIKSYLFDKQSNVINVSGFPSGIYSLKIEDRVAKIIIQ